MSAVASTDAVPVSVAVPAPKAVEVRRPTTQEIEDAEMKRWMLWFGLPALVASIFVAAAIGSGHAWIIGLAIAAIVIDIFVLVWLCMTSDTNGVIGDTAHSH
jgi:hypothetical protein